jgi:hypothetical protein
MRNIHLNPICFILLMFLSSFIIIRHDRDDQHYLNLAKKYEDLICHFSMGEGTLIHSEWVLTAGHVSYDLVKMTKQYDEVKVMVNHKEYLIDYVVVHPDYKPIINDIGLVKLKSAVPSQRFAALYSNSNEAGKLISIVGSGDTGDGVKGTHIMDKKLRGATNRIDGVDHNWIWFTFNDPGDKNCTELEGISGPGDSGGPAFIDDGKNVYIVGISSHQKNEGLKGTYGVREYYTRISNYTQWIYNVIQGARPASPVLSDHSITNEFLEEFVGVYGFRKILLKENQLYFQREEEPLILMKKIEKDIFLWDDNNTKLKFIRDQKNKIVAFNILRKNGEVIEVKKDDQ